jgi:hypothetical protein
VAGSGGLDSFIGRNQPIRNTFQNGQAVVVLYEQFVFNRRRCRRSSMAAGDGCLRETID